MFHKGILSDEERAALRESMAQGRIEAKERTAKILADAVAEGAHVQYLKSGLNITECETHIYIDNMGNVIIDTTLAKDIRKCLKNGYKITHITYLRASNQEDKLVGLICKVDRKAVLLRKTSDEQTNSEDDDPDENSDDGEDSVENS